MPASIVKSRGDEKSWAVAKKQASKKFKKGSTRYWKYTMGIFKNMTGREALDFEEVINLLTEKLGDSPEWLKVKAYCQVGKTGELTLTIGHKDYWFPVSEQAYRKFFKLATTQNRGIGLKFLKEYIRRYKGYTGKWNMNYYNKNKVCESKKEEGTVPEPILYHAVSAKCGLDPANIQKMVELLSKKATIQEIANNLHTSTTHIVNCLNILKAFGVVQHVLEALVAHYIDEVVEGEDPSKCVESLIH